MKTLILSAAALAAIALPATSTPAAAQSPSPSPRVIVTGEGTAALAPDMALVSLGVTQQAPTAREALDAASAAMARVIAAMKQEGIADRDLQTSNFSIYPVYVQPRPDAPDRGPRIDGYQVNNTLTVRLREIGRLGAVLDQAVTLGVNQGGGITFTNDDPSAALTEARAAAVRDAMARARTLAGAAGVSLGPVIEISEQSFQPQPMPMMMQARDAKAEGVPVEAGENSYRVQVTVTFELGR